MSSFQTFIKLDIFLIYQHVNRLKETEFLTTVEEDNFVNNVYADAFLGYELKSSESNNDRDVTDSDAPVQFEEISE